MLVADAPDAAAVIAAAERLRRSFEEPFVLDDIPVQIDASIGLARHPDDAQTAVELLKRRGRRHDHAKRDGAGVAAYREDRNDHSRSRLVLLGELRGGIPRGELELHYQPQVEIATGRSAGSRRSCAGAIPRTACSSPAPSCPRWSGRASCGRSPTACSPTRSRRPRRGARDRSPCPSR